MMEVSENQFSLVYNALSFTMASMAATTVFCWMRVVRACNAEFGSLPIRKIVIFSVAYRNSIFAHREVLRNDTRAL